MLGRVDHPWVQAELDAAIAPYKGRIPDEELAWMREQLAAALATETRGADLLRRAVPRTPVEKSGEVASDTDRQQRPDKPLRRLRGHR